MWPTCRMFFTFCGVKLFRMALCFNLTSIDKSSSSSSVEEFLLQQNVLLFVELPQRIYSSRTYLFLFLAHLVDFNFEFLSGVISLFLTFASISVFFEFISRSDFYGFIHEYLYNFKSFSMFNLFVVNKYKQIRTNYCNKLVHTTRC